MSLWQKGKGISRKIKFMLISIALVLAMVVCGIVAAVNLSQNNNGKVDGGIVADGSAITANTTFGKLTNGSSYKYTDTAGNQKSQTVNTSSTWGTAANPYVITTIQQFQGFTNLIDQNNASYRNAVFYLGADLDFKGETLTHSAYPANGFGGKFFGGWHVIKNLVYGGVAPTTAISGYAAGKTFVMSIISHTATGATLSDFSVDQSCTANRTANVATVGYLTIMGGFVGVSTGNIYLMNCSTYVNMTYKNTNTTADGGKALLSMGGFIGYLQVTSSTTQYTDCAYFRKCNCYTTMDVTGVTQPSSGTQLPNTVLQDNGIRYAGIAGITELYGLEAYYLNIYITSNQVNAGGGGGCVFPVGSLNKCILQNCFMKHQATVSGIDWTTDINVITYGSPICNSTNTCKIDIDHSYFISNKAAGLFRFNREDAVIRYNWAYKYNHNHDTNYDSGATYEIYGPSFSWNWNSAQDGYGASVPQGRAACKAKSEADLVKDAQKDSSLTGGITVNDDATGVIKGSAVAESTLRYYCSLESTQLVATGKYDPAVNAPINAGHTHAGLTFNGWGIGSYTSTSILKGTIPAYSRMGDKDLYALWTANAPTETKTNADVIYGDNEKTALSLKLTGVNTTFTQVAAADIKWTGPDGKAVAASTATAAFNTSTYTATLTFTRPTVAMSGNYTCTYTVKAAGSYKGITSTTRSVVLTLKVSPKVITAPKMVKNEFTYDGSEKALDWTPGASGIPKGYPNGATTATAVYTVTGTTKATAAGNYTATFTLVDTKNYCWAANDTAAKSISWKINQASIWGGASSGTGGTEYDDPSGGGGDPNDPDNPNPTPKPPTTTDDPNDIPKFDNELVGSYVQFNIPSGGRVGLALNSANNIGGSLIVTGSAWFSYADGTKKIIDGKFSWKNGAEIISYQDGIFDFEAAEKNGNKGKFKTYVVFTPDDPSIAPYEREVTLEVTGYFIYLQDTLINGYGSEDGYGTTAGYRDAEKLWIDYSSRVTVAPQFGKGKTTLEYYWGGVKQEKQIDASAPAGFNAKVYFLNGAIENNISGVNNSFIIDFSTTSGSAYYEKTFYIGYTPATDTVFHVFYVLEITSGSTSGAYEHNGLYYPFFPESESENLEILYSQLHEASLLSENPQVFEAVDARGTTTKAVTYLEAGQYLTTTNESVMSSVIALHYELDTEANKRLSSLIINGDGSTVAIVYLKAKYHTVTFLATGATSGGMQSKSVKYKSYIKSSMVGDNEVIPGISDPTRSSAKFVGWFTEQTGGTLIDFLNGNGGNGYQVLGNVTLYAHFEATDYYIVFDMNAVNENSSVDNAGGINIGIIPNNENKDVTVFDLVTWNYEQLFASYISQSGIKDTAGNFFYAESDDVTYDQEDFESPRWSAGNYVFRYNVDNLTSNISLTSSTVKPSALTYSFVNWYSGSTTMTSIRAPKNYSGTTTPDDVITLKAKWNKQTYSIIFDKQNGSARSTVSGIANLTSWEDIFAKNATSRSLEKPTRTGYTFAGWYATADCDDVIVTKDLGVAAKTNPENPLDVYYTYFSVQDYANRYPDIYWKNGTYSLNTITLYALWEEVDIEVDHEQEFDGGWIESIEPGYNVSIGVEVTVKLKAYDGYEFTNLIVGSRNRYIYDNGTVDEDGYHYVTFTVASTDVNFNAENPILDIRAVFEAKTYTISYNADGGDYVAGTTVTRTYKVTNLPTEDEIDDIINTGSVTREGDLAGIPLIVLPSKLTKLGYDFAGWEFEYVDSTRSRFAFVKEYEDDEEYGKSDVFGKTLYLTLSDLSDDEYVCQNISIKAIWIPQKTELRLYNVNYGADTIYGTDKDEQGGYIVTEIAGEDGEYQALYTDQTISIKSPVSESFYFMGWATKAGGEVIYPAELVAQKNPDGTYQRDEGDHIIYVASPVNYTLKASKDTSGNPTKANYLYGVWQIKEMEYVTITAKNNGSVYNGKGVELSAISSRAYQDDAQTGETITLVYEWYRIKDNAQGDSTQVNYYDLILKVTKRVFFDTNYSEIGYIEYDKTSGEIISWHLNAGDQEGDKNNVPSELQGNNYVEVRELDTNNLKLYADLIDTDTRSGTDNNLTTPADWTVKNVKEKGTYLCVASLQGGAVEAYGEITVEMQPARFDAVSFASGIKAYDGEAKNLYVNIGGDAVWKDGQKGYVFALTDGTEITVTYGYKPVGGYAHELVTQNGSLVDSNGYLKGSDGEWLKSVVNAGTYIVTAKFEITNDLGNYTIIETLEADLEITQRSITNVSFGVEHDVDGWTFDGNFSETYDKVEYVIAANIADRDMNGKLPDEVINGTVKLTVNVYYYDSSKSENKGALVDNDGSNNPLHAGSYIAEIQMMTNGNYKLGKIQTTQLFEIKKAILDLGISFANDEVTFDNKVHTIEIDSNNPIPENLKVTYSVNASLDEDLSTYEDKRNLSNEYYVKGDEGYTEVVTGGDNSVNRITNGGRHAGIYEVSVKLAFDESDPESKDYEPLEVEPAMLTINRVNLFKFYSNENHDGDEVSGKKNLLGGFYAEAPQSNAYVVNADRMTFIAGNADYPGDLLNSTDDAGKPYFDIHYTVYVYDNNAEDYFPYAAGTKAELQKYMESAKLINAPGKYKVEADITFESPLYKNDCEGVDTLAIFIEISEGEIDNIVAHYATGITMLQYIGEQFNIEEYVTSIDVNYKNGGGTLTLSGDELETVGIVYGNDKDGNAQTAFWKVGEAVDIVYRVLGVNSVPTANDKIKIMQKITEGADLRYSTNGSTYNSVPEYGLDLTEIAVENSAYTFRVYFDAINENGEWTTDSLYVDVTDIVYGNEEKGIEGLDLKRGANPIELGVSGLYDLSGLDVTLGAYKTVESDNNWKYTLDDGETWHDLDVDALSLPYMGKEYHIGVTFQGESGNEIIAYVDVESIINAGKYVIKADEVYTSGSRYTDNDMYYRLENVYLGTLTIEQRLLSFVWDSTRLTYTGDAQLPALLFEESGVWANDISAVDFRASYYKINKVGDNVSTVAVTPEAIVNAGDYRITITGIVVKPNSDSAKAANYLLPEECNYDFTIHKADIVFAEIHYHEYGVDDSGKEYNYGIDKSFENNPHGLRTDMLRGEFGSNKKVEGQFYFVVWDSTLQDYRILTDLEAGAQYLGEAGLTKPVLVMYSPLDMTNYNVLTKTINIDVISQVRKNELKVARKEGAAPFYIVGSKVAPDRFDVFEVYTSYYQENGVTYGKLSPLSTYSVEANGHLITAQNQYTVQESDELITITVYHSTNSAIYGTLDFKVYKSQPQKLVLSDTEKAKIKAIWYVGEKFELAISGPDAVKFTLYFENETETAELYFTDLTFTIAGNLYNTRDGKFTAAGTADITFSYAGLTCYLTLEVEDKVDLQIDTPETKTLKYEEDTVQKVPELEGHDPKAEAGSEFAKTVALKSIPGVDYTYEIMWRTVGDNGQFVYASIDRMLEEGTYVIIYHFTVTNPRYNTPEDFRIVVNVKSIAYEAEFSEFTEAQLTSVYSGNAINPPVAVVTNVKDLILERNLGAVATTKITSITRNGEDAQILGAGEYTVVTTAYYDGEEIGTKEYTYTVTRATNTAKLEVRNILVGEEVSYTVSDLKFGTFDAETMITFSDNAESGFTSVVPTEVGVWYIKLEVEGTDDYSAISITLRFTISYTGLSSDNKDDNGDVWVDVEGGEKGLAPGTRLEVSKVEQEELDGLKIRNRNVEEGYDVALKDENGEDAELNGEITIKLLISKEFRDINKLSVHMVTIDANGKTHTVEIKNVTRSEDGKYLIFSVSEVGRFVITEVVDTVPVGLLVAVIICAVIAAGLIVACVLVFLKKRAII